MSLERAPTAVIAEDEPLLAAALRAMLAAAWPELSIVQTLHHGEAALEAIGQLRPDVAFLDIRMPGCTGIEVAARLARAGGAVPLIVFVTAYDQYALEAFEAEAADYLLKPVGSDRLARCVARLRARLQVGDATDALQGLRRLLDRLQPPPGAVPAPAASPGTVATPMPTSAATPAPAPAPAPALRFIRASVGDVIRQIPVEQILYLEARDKYVSVVTAAASALVRMPLAELVASLDPARFSQIHRSTVVSLDAIESIRRDITGRLSVHLRERVQGREVKLAVSRQFAGQFRGM